jgi:hypothetical protein
MSDLKEKTLNFIKNHPLMTHEKFTALSNIKISDCYYYMLRSDIFPRGKRTNKKSGTTYVNLISLPSKDLSRKTKETITYILRAINTTQGTRLEILENFQTKSIEIRRIMV